MAVAQFTKRGRRVDGKTTIEQIPVTRRSASEGAAAAPAVRKIGRRVNGKLVMVSGGAVPVAAPQAAALAPDETAESTEPLTEADRDAEVHNTPVADAVDRIKDMGNDDAGNPVNVERVPAVIRHLRTVGEREARNPKHSGGRVTVLRAVDERIAELTALLPNP